MSCLRHLIFPLIYILTVQPEKCIRGGGEDTLAASFGSSASTLVSAVGSSGSRSEVALVGFPILH